MALRYGRFDGAGWKIPGVHYGGVAAAMESGRDGRIVADSWSGGVRSNRRSSSPGARNCGSAPRQRSASYPGRDCSRDGHGDRTSEETASWHVGIELEIARVVVRVADGTEARTEAAVLKG